jgi:hypothetical protein
MKETSTAGLIGVANAICGYLGATAMNEFTMIINFIVAAFSLGFALVKVIMIIIRHFKNKHGPDCDCVEQIEHAIDEITKKDE